MHISKWNIGHSCKTKQKKKFFFEISLWKWIVLILKLACSRRFVQEADVLVRERRRKIEIIQFVKNKEKQLCEQSQWVPTLLLPLYPRASNHFATWLKVDQTDRCRPSLIVDTEVWMQGDPMRHSIMLWSLIFSWTALSGFQSTGIPFFAQAAFSGFRLAGCTDFFSRFIPYFCPNPFGSPGSPYFCLGVST